MTASDAYAGIAPVYDASVGPLLRPMYRAVCSVVHAELGDGTRRVLDIGCGTGALCASLARIRNGKGELGVTGLDSSGAMLRRAAAKTRGSVVYVRGNAAQTGFKQASFDIATICLALHENKPGVIAVILGEVRRVVRPGGLLVVADHARGTGLLGKMFSLAALPVERLAGIHHYTMYRRFMREGGVAGCLVRHGFCVDQAHSLYGGTVAILLAKW